MGCDDDSFVATKARLMVFVCFNLGRRQTFFLFDEEQGQHLQAGTALAWNKGFSLVVGSILRSPIKLLLEFLHPWASSWG